MKPGLTFALAAMATLAFAAPSVAASAGGKAFLVRAIEGDNAGMQMGALAEKKGATAGVRKFGRMLHVDHAKLRKEAAALAKQLGAQVPTAPTSQGQKAYARLSELSGKKFDLHFLALAITDDENELNDFATATSAHNARVAKLAKAALPTLEDHLKVAQRLQVGTAPMSAQASG